MGAIEIMVWLAGILGFVCGFGGGMYLIRQWLSGRSKEELIQDKSLHWSYGVFVWAVAGVTAAAFVWIYKYYF